MARARKTLQAPVVVQPPESRPNFVRVEKNLNSLGFFTPAKHNGAAPRKKVLTVRREINGRIIEAQATILPSAEYGLPTTADLDKYLAFQKIVEQLRSKVGHISNPVGFTTAQLLNVLGLNTAGKNYQDINDWLQRMTLTGINSKGVVYMAKRRSWMSDTFHVFERIVTVRSSMPDGTTADRNYVWLSEWQLENINGNYLLPIDLETYRKLKNHIAKILVPLLQVWLYASRAEGRFEKRYSELCQILDITFHKHLSLIKRQLEPSLTELQRYGYLASFAIELTADGREYKIVAVHGHKFYRDQNVRAGLPVSNLLTPDTTLPLLKALTDRGVGESQARRLLRAIPPDQPVLHQLEYADSIVAKSRNIANPPGFYVYILRDNVLPPDSFESSVKRKLREEAERSKNEENTRQWHLQQAYQQFCREAIDKHIQTIEPAEYSTLIKKHATELKIHWPNVPSETLKEMAENTARQEIGRTLEIVPFDQFCANPQRTLFD
jgi:hypothetical protein